MAETLFVWKDFPPFRIMPFKGGTKNVWTVFEKKPHGYPTKATAMTPNDLGLGFIEVHMTRLSHGMPDENDFCWKANPKSP